MGSWGPQPWEQTPWWHPRRWFGYSMRRSVYGDPWDREYWQYQTYRQRAHEVLREKCDVN
jgi:hypothetical protein